MASFLSTGHGGRWFSKPVHVVAQEPIAINPKNISSRGRPALPEQN
jgi:hypothetical protein